MAPGEIIASDHINDIAERSTQRYASEAVLALENPTPTAGELAYIEDLRELRVFDSAFGWQLGGGGDFTGAVSLGTDTSSASYSFSVKRRVLDVARSLRIVLSGTAPRSGWVFMEQNSGGATQTKIEMGEGNVNLIGSTSAFRLGMERPGVPFQWRFAVGTNGDLLLQSSPDGTTFTTVETWSGI